VGKSGDPMRMFYIEKRLVLQWISSVKRLLTWSEEAVSVGQTQGLVGFVPALFNQVHSHKSSRASGCRPYDPWGGFFVKLTHPHQDFGELAGVRKD
jgi:hypothetical protein